MPNIHEVSLQRQRDAAWLVQLWLLVHGGDPVETVSVGEKVAVAAHGLVSALQEEFSSALSDEEFAERSEKRLGLRPIATERRVNRGGSPRICYQTLAGQVYHYQPTVGQLSALS